MRLTPTAGSPRVVRRVQHMASVAGRARGGGEGEDVCTSPLRPAARELYGEFSTWLRAFVKPRLGSFQRLQPFTQAVSTHRLPDRVKINST